MKGQFKHPLVGKFFHSFKNGEIELQGHVEAAVEPGFYLCRLYDWILGEAGYSKVFTTEQMVEGQFRFYEDQDYWKIEGDRLSKPRDVYEDVKNRGQA